ncbi:MAG: ArsC family reductase [Bacteroidia bacterium]
MSITIYGIKNCDTMKKAFNWLDEHGVKYTFHDYKKLGITTDKLTEWLQQVEVNKLINNKGTTFKKLTPEQQESISNKVHAIALMQNQPSMIKRPLVEVNHKIILGFNTADWDDIFK